MKRLDDGRRPIVIAGAALLVVIGLLLAISAPGGANESNKALGYGENTPKKPTNPRTPGGCDSYYGKTGQGSKIPDARDCRSKGARNAGNRKCAKKSSAARGKCLKSVKAKYRKAQKAIKKQRGAEKACTSAYTKGSKALSQDDPAYDTKFRALNDTFTRCLAKARG